MLKIHYLGHSQSERIVWLCEELGVPYEMQKYTRDAVTRLSPPELRAMHPLGAAPLIEEDGMLLGESAAIVEYILARYGKGRLQYARAGSSGFRVVSLLVPFFQRQSATGDGTLDDRRAMRFRAGSSGPGIATRTSG